MDASAVIIVAVIVVILGLGVLKVALHKSRGTPLPDEWTQGDDLTIA